MKRQNPGLAILLPLALLFLVGFTFRAESPPAGGYFMTVAEEDIPESVPTEAKRNLVGKWEMTLSTDKKYQISKDGNVLVKGSFDLSGGQITVTDEEGVLACTGQPSMETGTYNWTYEEGKLSFKIVDDKCEGRRLVLSLRSWQKED